MSELKLHALGSNDHLETLKERYDSLKEKIKESSKLTESEKKAEMDALNTSFKKEKKNIKSNNY
ncbi:hypothetical protein H7U19_00300 [Hyunsoonleella sp. SJ7]|uniref:Uncharacterized protein n=1 Tax=Hyunsoonleella aquatilis TaxID=2762758 RepID=A0A923HBB2_9FLAO|nr:hypothetical protein [Hyunsoonleella aquatilis]MBC3756823.1 hypothetical protein [Hyunsoonleella aquatilis]